MTLMEIIKRDLTNAMKEQDKFSLGVYRMLKSALQLEQINAKHDLSDSEVIAIIKKQVKIRKDSLLEYQKYNRMDLMENLEKEIAIMKKYLPEELSEAEIDKEILEVFQDVNPQSMKDMGSIMKILTSRIANRADMSYVSSIVKSKLSGK